MALAQVLISETLSKSMRHPPAAKTLGATPGATRLFHLLKLPTDQVYLQQVDMPSLARDRGEMRGNPHISRIYLASHRFVRKKDIPKSTGQSAVSNKTTFLLRVDPIFRDTVLHSHFQSITNIDRTSHRTGHIWKLPSSPHLRV